MHSIVTTFRGAVIKVEVANFCAAMDTLIDQDGAATESILIKQVIVCLFVCLFVCLSICSPMDGQTARPNGLKFGR